MKIVKINSDCSLTNDKFHVPQTCNTVLLETVNEPKLYVELNDCRERRLSKLSGGIIIKLVTQFISTIYVK